jgi:predicted nucleic-acid-binding Zn-ribbon protein
VKRSHTVILNDYTCPSCQTTYRSGQIQFTGEETAEQREQLFVKAKTCEKCGCDIHNHEKRELLQTA